MAQARGRNIWDRAFEDAIAPDGASRKAYDKAVANWLRQDNVRVLLDRQPEAVAAGVRNALLEPFHARQVMLQFEDEIVQYFAWLDTYRAAKTELRSNAEGIFRRPSTWVYLAIATAFTVIFIKAWGIQLGFAGATALAIISGSRSATHTMRSRTRHSRDRTPRTSVITPLANSIAVVFFWVSTSRARSFWHRSMRTRTPVAYVHYVVERLNHGGVYPDSGRPSSVGLRLTADRGRVVPWRAAVELSEKISQLDGGTLALSGPRGSGKTTLLEGALTTATLPVYAHTPASYAPQEFLLNLFVDVCEGYLRMRGISVPSYKRVSVLFGSGRVRAVHLGTLIWRCIICLAAAGMLVIAAKGGAEWVAQSQGFDVGSRAVNLWKHISEFYATTVTGQSPYILILLAISAVIALRVAMVKGLVDYLRFILRAIYLLGAIVAIYTVMAPYRSVRELFYSLPSLLDIGNILDNPVVTILVPFTIDMGTRIGRLRTNPEKTQAWSQAVVTGYILSGLSILLYYSQGGRQVPTLEVRALTRLALVIAAVALLFAALRKPMRRAYPLARQCRDQLHRLRTVQTKTTSWNPAVQQFGSLAGGSSSGYSTLPPNYPELVSDFRRLLSSIAQEIYEERGTCIIAVDELDRLGSADAAIGFLNELKAVFGIPYVHFLLAVADDVGATFVRRGLPNRDATDSTLDDIVHVINFNVDEARALLLRRVPNLGDSNILFAYALSGGLPRDLVRYCRRIVDLHRSLPAESADSVIRLLAAEELTQVLGGFRLLLAKLPLTTQSGAALHLLRKLIFETGNRRRSSVASLEESLTALVRHGQAAPQGDGVRGLPDEEGALIAEASTFAYFLLTVLRIFISPNLMSRVHISTPEEWRGHPAHLAEARLELGVSAYSAQRVINDFRDAWGMEILLGDPA
ncbi:P-loop NTPase fold protein [Streptomyces sp. NPDC059371]|uniref:P-loop NTPase fold protein n=1 Tax=Streptomyces sp. NPDC059371 TaxID=3346812 RepID=UPI0036B6FCAA